MMVYRLRVGLIGALVAATLLLGGCAGSDGYDDDTANALQARVLEVTEAAGNDPASALARLADLDSAISDAVARGDLSDDRRDSIVSAMELVRGDLETAVAAKAAEAAEARAAAEVAARKAAAAAEEAARQAEDDNGGPGKGDSEEQGKSDKDKDDD